jgi:uncharacterized protein YycO
MIRQIQALLILSILLCGQQTWAELRDGDIVFQQSQSSQSKAIQLATHSPYSHMGIVFLKNSKPYVFEAERTVVSTPLQRWIARGAGNAYVVKRVRNLDPDAPSKLRKTATRFTGRPYDLYFGWSDDRIYCSELVWKIYKEATGLEIGTLRQLREFDLTHPVVAAKMKDRYGNSIPLNQSVISPADMFSSTLLEGVPENGGAASR